MLKFVKQILPRYFIKCNFSTNIFWKIFMMKILENYFYENFDKFYDEIFNIFYHKIIEFFIEIFARNG